MKIVSAKSTDGIYYKGLLSTSKESAKGIIIHIHGMAGSIVFNQFYTDMHKLYPESGWDFLVAEHRGTGSITQFNSDKGVLNLGNSMEIFEECVHDIQGWINYAKNLGYKKIWLQAHSLGSSKVAYYISQLKENDVEGLILLSPSDMVGLVNDEIGIKDHNKLYPEALSLIKDNKPTQLLSDFLWESMTLSAQSYNSFFGENAKDAIFNFGIPDLGWSVVNSLDLQVLAVTGTKDEGIVAVMDAYKAMSLLESQLVNSSRKKTIVYKDAEHDFNGFGEQICKDVLTFINH